MDNDSAPWEPAGLPTFGVGDRVRIDLGECRHLAGWHGTIEQGRTGMVVAVDGGDPDAPADHGYVVWFDQPIRSHRSWQYSRWELRPFDALEALREMQRGD